jgi:hypothetical protein
MHGAMNEHNGLSAILLVIVFNIFVYVFNETYSHKTAHWFHHPLNMQERVTLQFQLAANRL